MPHSTVETLLGLVARIGRELRPANRDDVLSYPHALALLADLEDELACLAIALPSEPRLCGRPLGYLPSRHPKALANTLAGHASSIHPALRPRAQTEDFTE